MAERLHRCNVVLLGKAGAGRSTVAKKIAGLEDHFTFSSSVRNQTKQTRCHKVLVNGPDGKMYAIKPIDTAQGLIRHRDANQQRDF